MSSGRVDVEALRAATEARFGDVLEAVGAERAKWARPERGRARCMNGCSAGFSISYRDGRAYCHYEAKGWDAIALVRERYGLSFVEAAERLEDILGGTFTEAPRPRPEVVREIRNAEDVGRLWDALPPPDETTEAYIKSRGLYSLPGIVKANPPGASADDYLAFRARQGFRLAFAARRPDGTVANISLRFTGCGPPPDEKKTVSLDRCGTRNVAIMRPEAAGLAGPDFSEDAVLICEGGPDFLAWTARVDREAMEQEAPSTWVLGILGAGIAVDVVATFARLLRGRWVRIALDADVPGEKAAALAIVAAWTAGAKRVTRLTLEGVKDAAEAAEKEARRG